MAIKGDGGVGGNYVNEYGDGASWIRGALLGKGAFGRVYKATLRYGRSKYSCYPPEMAVKSAEVSISSTLQKEKEIMNNLSASPYVVRCFGEETTLGDTGLMAYNLLMEIGSGGTLADRIKESGINGLPEIEVRAHTRSILRGLNHIHENGYVHRDLKPQNILLVSKAHGEGKFRAKIGDFGLAKREKQSNKKRKLMKAYWRGTSMYLSPEAVVSGVQESSSDVWAVGCIVLEMLTGKAPWEGEKNSEEILRKIGTENQYPKIPNEISKEAKDFLKRCFVRKSMFRFTCDMLLYHPFVDGLEDDYDDDEEDVEELEDSEGLIYENNDEYEKDSICSSSEENESELVALTSKSSERVYKGQNRPVNLTIPAGI